MVRFKTNLLMYCNQMVDKKTILGEVTIFFSVWGKNIYDFIDEYRIYVSVTGKLVFKNLILSLFFCHYGWVGKFFYVQYIL